MSGYDAPRLLSLVHIAQLLTIDAVNDGSEQLQDASAGELLSFSPRAIFASTLDSMAYRSAAESFSFGSYQSASVAGFAAHFVLAQVVPQYLADYDSILGYQLQNVSLDIARQAASLGEGLATSLLQNRCASKSDHEVAALAACGSLRIFIQCCIWVWVLILTNVV